MSDFNLPDYKQQSPEVRDRFERLKQRPVTMEVKGLTKTFNSHHGEVTALKNIDLKIHKREFVCVIGPSGCGKSTLIRILAGLEQASAGQVLLDGVEGDRRGGVARRCGRRGGGGWRCCWWCCW